MRYAIGLHDTDALRYDGSLVRDVDPSFLANDHVKMCVRRRHCRRVSMDEVDQVIQFRTLSKPSCGFHTALCEIDSCHTAADPMG